jgi:hypothetical protein
MINPPGEITYWCFEHFGLRAIPPEAGSPQAGMIDDVAADSKKT